jgi:hypothetical protein
MEPPDLHHSRARLIRLAFFSLVGTAARDSDRIELRRPTGQPILQVVPSAGQGKMRGLAVNGPPEDSDDVEAWIDAVLAAQRSAGGQS